MTKRPTVHWVQNLQRYAGAAVTGFKRDSKIYAQPSLSLLGSSVSCFFRALTTRARCCIAALNTARITG